MVKVRFRLYLKLFDVGLIWGFYRPTFLVIEIDLLRFSILVQCIAISLYWLYLKINDISVEDKLGIKAQWIERF